ncbi:MAG TPA: hypothetical protein VIE43_24475 [Thermoanaerobaculia bacterium]|jgi:hypothetical protein|nr:hypothetical protein [Thermoanaerobaculia bacterium]
MATKVLLNEIDRTAEAEFDTAKASEPALGKDWLRSEEDEAWQTL